MLHRAPLQSSCGMAFHAALLRRPSAGSLGISQNMGFLKLLLRPIQTCMLHEPCADMPLPLPPPQLHTCREAQIFLSEWDTLLSGGNEWAMLFEFMDDAGLAPVEQHAWVGQAVMHAAEMLADYSRRFVYPSRSWPLLVMWLVLRPAAESCTFRQNCATELLELEGADADQTCLKLRFLFERELTQAKSTGTLCPRLWQLIHSIALLWTLDTAEIEGVNSVIKTASARAPFLGWAGGKAHVS